MFPECLAAADAPPTWLFALFPVSFVGMWCLVSTLLGRMAGHGELLARFPPVAESCEQTFGMASGRMRGVNFNGALHVGIGSRGLHLAANWLFRPVFQRGIPCIPWEEIKLVTAAPTGFGRIFKGSRFEVPSLGLAFSIGGEAGRAVEAKLVSRFGAPPAGGRSLVR